MVKQKNVINQNYLEKIPVKNETLCWEADENKMVTQKLMKKPEYTQVHLDENGSFIWQLIDGKKDIIELGKIVKEHFGEAAEPLYPRIAKFFQILESYGFVSLEEKENGR